MGRDTEYRLDNATIEIDPSEVEAVDESMEDMPTSVDRHFETREHPELGTRWVFKAHSARAAASSDAVGGPSCAPPSFV